MWVLTIDKGPNPTNLWWEVGLPSHFEGLKYPSACFIAMYFIIGLCHHSALLGPLQPLQLPQNSSPYTCPRQFTIPILWHMGPIAKGPNQCFHQHVGQNTNQYSSNIQLGIRDENRSSLKAGNVAQNTKSEPKPSSSLENMYHYHHH